MERICYGCNKHITAPQSANGQKALDWVMENNEEFEGWVHCKGEPEEFLQEDDEELKKLLEDMGVLFYENSIHVCKECVVSQAEQEGITIPDEV